MNSILFFTNFITAAAMVILAVRVHVLRKKLASDALTGLSSRKELMKHLEKQVEALGDEEKLVVSMIDLDDFKSINDTQGHLAGDRHLAEFARSLKTECEKYAKNPFLARYGGDEFIITGMQPEDAEKIREALKEKSELGFSMGTVSVCGCEKADVAEVLSRADRAMYEMKKRKKKTINESL